MKSRIMSAIAIVAFVFSFAISPVFANNIIPQDSTKAKTTTVHHHKKASKAGSKSTMKAAHKAHKKTSKKKSSTKVDTTKD
jgi:cytoskeletal protein RodZ